MTRASTLCVLSSTLAVLFTADAASAGTLTVHTNTVKPNVHLGNKSGAGNGFETKNFNFGFANPTITGTATEGAGAGKVKFNEFGPSKIHRLNPQPLPPG